MTKRDAIDWTAVEADYRAGTLSNRQIAERHGVSESAIRKRATAGEWVRTSGKSAHQSAHQPLAEILPPLDRPLRSADEVRDHVEHGREIASRMLDELDATTSHVGELAAMIEEETAEDRDGKRRNAMLKAISLPARAMTLKTLAQALAVMKEVAGGASGKKEEAKAQAENAAKPGNKFAPPAPPKLVVDNGR
ncbi:Lrp/AsnC family transcriptional regulator [Azospirillum sp. SYSU D00513]|uniref:Lrp/AsnC family transcriptional regulator n=1 Tax=Azospirillum sp. SYSU D00513 TaxID=2812561 RepID=UPI001A967746|nr:Lrp/AsnC family transcriptional regulator [Azospirillum sp. SYSU D00513]